MNESEDAAGVVEHRRGGYGEPLIRARSKDFGTFLAEHGPGFFVGAACDRTICAVEHLMAFSPDQLLLALAEHVAERLVHIGDGVIEIMQGNGVGHGVKGDGPFACGGGQGFLGPLALASRSRLSRAREMAAATSSRRATSLS